MFLAATTTQVKREPTSTSGLETDNALPSYKRMEASSASLDKGTSQRDTDHAPVTGIDEIFPSFQEAVAKEDWDTIKYLLEDTIYLINTDTGGQTEFLDLMSFLAGPALNLIFSRLTDSLDQEYKIYYTNEEGVSTQEEDSVATLEEFIFQTLSTTACMYEPDNTDKYSVKEDDDIHIPTSSSKAMFVGTFRDRITEEEFKEKDSILQKKIEQTEFYLRDIVLFASVNHLILPVDNLNGGKEEVDGMREIFENAILRNFKKVRIPATWLMLSINMRHTGKCTISLTECRHIASKLGITATTLPKVLWFLHYHCGILLYFPDVDGFDQIIILDIQVWSFDNEDFIEKSLVLILLSS